MVWGSSGVIIRNNFIGVLHGLFSFGHSSGKIAFNHVVPRATQGYFSEFSIGEILRERKPQFMLTCARGSSDHAATYGKYLIETFAGVPTASFAPSVSSIYAAKQNMQGGVFLALSQSGASPDLVTSAPPSIAPARCLMDTNRVNLCNESSRRAAFRWRRPWRTTCAAARPAPIP